jgi:hypothetical protein
VSNKGKLKWPHGRHGLCGDAHNQKKWDVPGEVQQQYMAGQVRAQTAAAAADNGVAWRLVRAMTMRCMLRACPTLQVMMQLPMLKCQTAQSGGWATAVAASFMGKMIMSCFLCTSSNMHLHACLS